ncbi:MAG: FHA domain-containing protein [Chloroflexia bacterium]
MEKNEQGEDQFVVWDLASKNGTFVNDQRIRAPTPLKENDTVRVGTTTFVLKIIS